MIELIKIEWIKTFGKMRTYISFAAIFVLIALIFTGLKVDGGQFITHSTAFRGLRQSFFIVGDLLNGYFISHLVMFFTMVHIPFLIVLVAGDQIAGEASGGTLRVLLTRPPSRLKILTAKAVVSLIYSALLILTLGVLSLGVGSILFGTGNLLIADKGILILTGEQALQRFAIAYPLAILSMCVVTALAFLLSVLVENAIGPIIGTMAIIIISVIISETPISLFEKIKPFLFTTYSTVWQKAFYNPIPVADIMRSSGYLCVFMLVFFAIAFFIFNRKDILS